MIYAVVVEIPCNQSNSRANGPVCSKDPPCQLRQDPGLERLIIYPSQSLAQKCSNCSKQRYPIPNAREMHPGKKCEKPRQLEQQQVRLMHAEEKAPRHFHMMFDATPRNASGDGVRSAVMTVVEKEFSGRRRNLFRLGASRLGKVPSWSWQE